MNINHQNVALLIAQLLSVKLSFFSFSINMNLSIPYQRQKDILTISSSEYHINHKIV